MRLQSITIIITFKDLLFTSFYSKFYQALYVIPVTGVTFLKRVLCIEQFVIDDPTESVRICAAFIVKYTQIIMINKNNGIDDLLLIF